MKKVLLACLIACLALAGSIACKKDAVTDLPTARAEALLNFLPREAHGVIVADFHRAMTLDAVRKALTEEDGAESYAEFVAMTGIDPMEDVFGLAVALIGPLSADDMEGAAVINMKFDRDAILTKLREDAPGFRETVYNGVALYAFSENEDDARPVFGAILDDRHIIAGSESGVKALIDVSLKKAEPLSKNPDLTGIIKTVDKNSLLWGAFVVPAETVADAAEGNPMLASLQGINALSLQFDYKNKTMNAEIKAMGGTAEQNKELADMLLGFKAIIGLASSEEPALSELLRAIDVSSGADFIKISAAISDKLMDELRHSAQDKVSGFVAPRDEDDSEDF